MPVKVLIPTPLRPFVGKRDTIELAAKTVGEALGQLTSEFSELKKHLYTDDGRIRSFVNVYLNDEDIRYQHRGRPINFKPFRKGFAAWRRRQRLWKIRSYRRKKYSAIAATSSCPKSEWTGSLS